MRRTLANRPVALIVGIFTLVSAALLHANPFGDGSISWPVSIAIALVGNCLLAYVITSWAAPYLASTGGRAGAADADPEAVAVAERWTAGTLLLFGVFALLAVAFASRELVITPTERLERNATLVKRTVEAKAPARYRPMLGAADTWKISERTLRTCVPPPDTKDSSWCVVVRSEGDSLAVTKAGPGLSNIEQARKWHADATGPTGR